ncbi:MAG TPA: hypothetical protein VHB74_11675 [Devosia sp.]|nr:hypothetical protein [Devosia sp.]
MNRSYVLVKDHLEQAWNILSVDDGDTFHLRQALHVMIDFIEELQYRPGRPQAEIIAFPNGRRERSDRV